MARPKEFILVHVTALLEEQTGGAPIVILHDEKTDRIVPIWIGEIEARAIEQALDGIENARPLTHELFLTVLSKCGARIVGVHIDELKDQTYYAVLSVKVGSRVLDIDARPSDCLALALSADAPVYVAKDILDSASEPNPFDIRVHRGMKKAKKDFTADELRTLRDLLLKAREREQNKL